MVVGNNLVHIVVSNYEVDQLYKELDSMLTKEEHNLGSSRRVKELYPLLSEISRALRMDLR